MKTKSIIITRCSNGFVISFGFDTIHKGPADKLVATSIDQVIETVTAYLTLEFAQPSKTPSDVSSED